MSRWVIDCVFLAIILIPSKGSFYTESNYGSIQLDSENCILTYDGTKDVSSSERERNKPVAIQIEDFGPNQQIKSSIPVQFIVRVKLRITKLLFFEKITI